MYLSKLFAVLIIVMGFWKKGDFCVRQKYANNSSFFHYLKLLEIDTGHPHDNLKTFSSKLKVLLTRKVENARDGIYRELVCSYVYNSCHYMRSIKYLLIDEGKSELERLITHDNHSVFAFKDQVTQMLNVLYNFGLTKSIDQLWMMHLYSNRLKSMDKRQMIEDRQVRNSVLHDHNLVYQRLTRFTELNCKWDNVYNDRYSDSIHFRQFGDISFLQTSILNYIETFTTTVQERFVKLNEIIVLEKCNSYFSIEHLVLFPVIGNINIMEKLMFDFMEVPQDSDCTFTYSEITNNCYGKNITESVESLICDAVERHNVFINIVKYVMLYNSWKHLWEINSILLCSDSQEQTVDKEWTKPLRKIKWHNHLISNYYNTIVRVLSVKQDEQFKYMADMFKLPPLVFVDIVENKTKIDRILVMIKEINSKYFKLDESNFSASKFTDTYFVDSFDFLFEELSIKDSIIFSFTELIQFPRLESVLSFYVFAKYIEKITSDVDFEVIGSFIEFSMKHNLFFRQLIDVQ